jgi:predicted regulator of amino acid metabolism with ACT domain
MLQSKLEEEEQSKLFAKISFTAKILKCPPPVGFGMVVAEDNKRGGIAAKVSQSLTHSLSLDIL